MNGGKRVAFVGRVERSITTDRMPADGLNKNGRGGYSIIVQYNNLSALDLGALLSSYMYLKGALNKSLNE